MDLARCISLHNRIVQHAVEKLGKKSAAKITRNWFTFFKDAKAESERENLPDDIVRFLESVDVVDSTLLSFNPYLRGLSPPADLQGGASREAKDSWRKQFGNKKCVILYQAVDKEDTRGLVMNLETLKCHYISSVENEIDASWSWQPLDVILEKWWGLVQSGKYTVDSNFDPLQTDSEYGAVGWLAQPYISSDVKEAVEAWDDYVSTIIRKLPEETRKQLPTTVTTGWVDAAQLDKLNITGFVRDFLSQARRPPKEVKFIAPGLRVLDDDLLKQFGHVLQQRQEDFEWLDPMEMPFPLCPATERFAETSLAAALEGLDFLRKQFLFDDQAGLYIRPSAEALYSDTVAMISPYSNPLYDGPIFELKHRLFEYQSQSGCPWQPSHDVRLVSLISQWIYFLNDGFWTVGPEGVEGGSEGWQKLATQTNREKLRLPEICH